MTQNVPAYIKYIENLLNGVGGKDPFISKIVQTVKYNNFNITRKQFDTLERYRRGDKSRYSTKSENINKNQYTPYQFQPNTNFLSKAEHDKMMDDLRGRSIDFIDYLMFVKSMAEDEEIYDSMLSNLGKGNLDKLRFKSAERKILNLTGDPLLSPANYSKVMDFYKKYKNEYPKWAETNKFYFNSLKN